MSRLISCKYCGRIHASNYDCGKRPQKRYRRHQEEAGRYSTAWVKKSQEIKAEAHYLCEYCMAQGVLTYDGLEVHHITKLRDWPDGLLVDGNLICLCSRHHKLAERGDINARELTEIVERRFNPPLPLRTVSQFITLTN